MIFRKDIKVKDMANFCPQCGESLKLYAKFCTGCGRSVGESKMPDTFDYCRKDYCDTNDEVIHIMMDDIEVIDTSEYSSEIAKQFSVPDVAEPLLKDAKAILKKIEKMLYSSTAIVNLVKANIPDVALQAVLTDKQKHQIAKGALELMTKKDGSLMANLVNPETKKIVATVPLKKLKLTPEVTQAMTNYATQMQLAQIAEEIQLVQHAVEEMRQGLEYDRLATAYSCQQKLIQAMEINNPELRAMALMQIASYAEDSRNLLMLSQKTNVGFIMDQPESFFGKIMQGSTPEKIDSRMNEIRESLCAVNMVSLAEAIAYQELGEDSAARKSLAYYGEFVQKTYLAVPGLVERLDLIDPSPKNYWSKTLPDIERRIKSLPCNQDQNLIEEGVEENAEEV